MAQYGWSHHDDFSEIQEGTRAVNGDDEDWLVNPDDDDDDDNDDDDRNTQNRHLPIDPNSTSPVFILHYEDFFERYNETVEALMQFLQLPIQPDASPLPFHVGKQYRKYYTLDQYNHMTRVTEELATPEAWELLRRYFKSDAPEEYDFNEYTEDTEREQEEGDLRQRRSQTDPSNRHAQESAEERNDWQSTCNEVWLLIHRHVFMAFPFQYFHDD